MEMEDSSLTAKYVDFALSDGGYFATAEFKSAWGSSVAHWLVSGPNSIGVPAFLLSISTPLTSFATSEMAHEAKLLAEDFIIPMARHLSSSPGLGDRLPPFSQAGRSRIFELHLQAQVENRELKLLPLQVQTECLFRMASYLEVVAPLKIIAAHQGVAVSTVETRIKKGRASGAIPRARELKERAIGMKVERNAEES